MPRARRVSPHRDGACSRSSSSSAIVFSFRSPYFLTLPNFVDLIEAYAVTTILAAGVFVVLVSGGIDISFAATASVDAISCARLRCHAATAAGPLPDHRACLRRRLRCSAASMRC